MKWIIQLKFSSKAMIENLSCKGIDFIFNYNFPASVFMKAMTSV